MTEKPPKLVHVHILLYRRDWEYLRDCLEYSSRSKAVRELLHKAVQRVKSEKGEGDD